MLIHVNKIVLLPVERKPSNPVIYSVVAENGFCKALLMIPSGVWWLVPFEATTEVCSAVVS